MKLYVLGTGHATVIDGYNTCFALENNGEHILVDAGGGKQVLKQIRDIGLDVNKLKYAFITHNHTDHLLGMIWIIRTVIQGYMKNLRTESFTLYGSKECLEAIKEICLITLGEKNWNRVINEKLFLKEIKDGQKEQIIGMNFEFFDTKNNEMPQMAFYIEDEQFMFAGDVPLDESYFNKFKYQKCVCLEAFCLEKDREKNSVPLRKHKTVEEACDIANILNPQRLILWHREDYSGASEDYLKVAAKIFDNKILVPEDLDIIEL